MADMSVDKLAGMFRDRQRETVERAYRNYGAELVRYVQKKFGSGPPEPEEVAQGAFARFAALEEPSKIGNPRAYLYQCARSIVFDHRRHQSVRARLDKDPAVADVEETSANLDAERVLAGRERLAIVDRAVRSMEPRLRRVLIMHAIHELAFTEIARREGLSPTRVMQLYAKAVVQCEQALRKAEVSE